MNLVLKSHEIAAAYFKDKPLMFSIDATLGRGRDALFLAKLTGEGGKVFGFDVQSEAVEASKNLFGQNGFSKLSEFFNVGHENMADSIGADFDGKIDCVFFNLGWLPLSDKSVTTKASTTLVALDSALSMMRRGGLLEVLSYRGQAGGSQEFRAVKTFFDSNFKSIETFGDESNSLSPILFSAHKE